MNTAARVRRAIAFFYLQEEPERARLPASPALKAKYAALKLRKDSTPNA